MDSHPSFPLKENSFLKNKTAIICGLVVLCALVFNSCSNTAPQVVLSDAKVVFDFEDEKSVPKQKMNLFLKMDSDVRRAELLNIYHNRTGLRWIVSNPMISQAENYYYAGYTNIQGVSQSGERIPKGDYSVHYIDAEGREESTSFSINYDEKILAMKSNEFLSTLKNSNPKILIGIYSKELNLLFYGSPKKEWNVTKDMKNIKNELIFNSYSGSSFYRVFFVIDNNVFIMPQVEKSGEK